MNEPRTYQAVRVGDVADWKLICEISARGMSARLKHTDPTQEMVTLFDEHWSDGEDLLSKIENTVYDHPQVLDDFSAELTVIAPKSIWVPADIVEDDDGARRGHRFGDGKTNTIRSPGDQGNFALQAEIYHK